jgi:two-component system nitrate/nitrite response regulator NarL
MTDPCPTTLIDPNRLFRDGLRYLLAGTRFAVAAEFGTVAHALAHGGTVPGLLLVGQAEPVPGDLEQLRQACPAARLVVLADRVTIDGVRDAMAAGVDGLLAKAVSPEALVQSLELVMMGETVYPTNLAALLAEVGAPVPQASPRGLSAREQEILHLLVTGASNKLIAIRLGIAEATVKVHLKTMLRKIDVSNRTQAAVWAMNNGFTPVPADGPASGPQAASA